MSPQLELSLRLGCFLSVLLLMTLWECVSPRRRLIAAKAPRWASNLGLVVLNAFVVRLAVPITAVATAVTAEAQGWGVLNLVPWPPWLELGLAVLALDLAVYLQHVMFHAVPWLWALHQVHHADLDFDVTTGLRFHTLEILLSALLRLAVVCAIGPSVFAVVSFEALLNATAMFNHSNIRLPGRLDHALRWVVVTPDMHRVHHSAVDCEMHRNFGFNLPWWDVLLGTYRNQPAAGHERMMIGVMHLRDERQVDRLPGMLALPFHGRPGSSLPRETARPDSDSASAAETDEPGRVHFTGRM